MSAWAAEPSLAPYEVLAIKYAEADALPPGTVQIGMDPHHSPFDMTYYVWLIRRGSEVIVVDTGFNPASGAKRGRRLLRCPTEPLRQLGVDPLTVQTLIVTHLHYDHIGNSDFFPNATFHLQDKEMAFATGRYEGMSKMARPLLPSGEAPPLPPDVMQSGGWRLVRTARRERGHRPDTCSRLAIA